jgi:hypothetical protein
LIDKFTLRVFGIPDAAQKEKPGDNKIAGYEEVILLYYNVSILDRDS